MATQTPYAEDVAPIVQGGVCAFQGKKSVHWIGRISELAAGGRKIDLPKGFLPTRWVVSAKALEDPVGVYNLGVGLADGTVVTITGKQQTLTAGAPEDGTFADTTSGAAITDTVCQVKGDYDGDDDDSVPDKGSGNLGGVIASAVFSGNPVVATEDQYFTITATKTSGTLNRLSNDCLVEVRLYLDQVDPHPVKQF